MSKEVKVLVLAMLVSLGACATGRAAGTDAQETDALAAPADAPMIHARNQNWQDVDVFAIRPGMKIRLGMITSMGAGNFRLPSNAYAGGPGLRILVSPIGGPRDYLTPEFQLAQGQTLELDIENNLVMSSYSIR